MRRLLVIANLHHASPRIPGLVSALPEHGWEAVIITTPLEANATEVLGFPEGFLDKARVIEAPYRGDVFWMWRGVFRLLGFDMKESLTEQIKDRAGVCHKRSYVDDLMRAYQTLFAYPDTERTWRRPGLRTARQIAKSQSFDAILSSSPFPTSHRIAHQLQIINHTICVASGSVLSRDDERARMGKLACFTHLVPQRRAQFGICS